MPHRRQPQHPPPPDGVERRREFRRETDYEKQEIVEHAADDAPIVHGLLRTYRVAVAIGGLCALVASTGTAIGMSFHGPKQDLADVRTALNLRVDTNVAKITLLRKQFDSVVVVLGEMAANMRTIKALACEQARQQNPGTARVANCGDAP